MSRVIKFRVFNINKNKMSKPFTLEDFANDQDGECGENEFELKRYIRYGEYEHNILMQFTGLKDKRGVEIFEGDIIRTNGDEVLVHEVFYRQEVCSFELRRPAKNFIYQLGTPEIYLEVIGNIYEHPSLIIGEKGN